MNLQQTMSKIAHRDLTLDEAKDFCNDQFGMVAAYLYENLPDNYKAAIIGEHFTLSTIEAELADIKAFDDAGAADLARVLELAIKQIEG